jgi:hypothetical protein
MMPPESSEGSEGVPLSLNGGMPSMVTSMVTLDPAAVWTQGWVWLRDVAVFPVVSASTEIAWASPCGGDGLHGVGDGEGVGVAPPGGVGGGLPIGVGLAHGGGAAVGVGEGVGVGVFTVGVWV